MLVVMMEQSKQIQFILVSVLLFPILNFVNCANILGMFMYPSLSHQKVFQFVWREFSKKGHNVTVVTPNPLNDSTLENLHEINADYLYDILKEKTPRSVYSKKQLDTQVMKKSRSLLDDCLFRLFSDVNVQNIILEKDPKYDLIIVQAVYPFFMALGKKLKAPIVTIFSAISPNAWYERHGNPNHPLLYSDLFFDAPNNGENLWTKYLAIRYFIWSYYYWTVDSIFRNDRLAKQFFGDDFPNVGPLQTKMNAFFVNTNLVFGPVRPNSPIVFNTAPMHLSEPKTLPKDLQEILDKATEGVVYVSFGSNIKSNDLEESLKQNLLQAFQKLPFLILWKFESDHLPDKPSNVIIRKWFPQNDILAHPNIKVFVMQGGQQSLEEAISNEVPIVGFPFHLDQNMNVRRAAEFGFGEELKELSSDSLETAILKVARSQNYKEKIQSARRILFDKPMTGLETVMWWSDYSMRWKTTQHLKPPSIDLSWFEFFLLDVIILAMSFPMISIFIILKIK